jgi:uncharacterized membrane protein YbjE (DUF340 family)
MLSAYHVHPEFGYFCPTPYRRRELLVAVVSILFGAMIGGSIATLSRLLKMQLKWALASGWRCLRV